MRTHPRATDYNMRSQCYLPPDTGKRAPPAAKQAGTRCTCSRAIKVDLGGWLYTEMSVRNATK